MNDSSKKVSQAKKARRKANSVRESRLLKDMYGPVPCAPGEDH